MDVIVSHIVAIQAALQRLFLCRQVLHPEKNSYATPCRRLTPSALPLTPWLCRLIQADGVVVYFLQDGSHSDSTASKPPRFCTVSKHVKPGRVVVSSSFAPPVSVLTTKTKHQLLNEKHTSVFFLHHQISFPKSFPKIFPVSFSTCCSHSPKQDILEI